MLKSAAGVKLLSSRCRAHCPLWVLPEVVELEVVTGALHVDFAQCQLRGGTFQKYTRFLYWPAAKSLAKLWALRCSHTVHFAPAVGYDSDGRSRSASAASHVTSCSALRRYMTCRRIM